MRLVITLRVIIGSKLCRHVRHVRHVSAATDAAASNEFTLCINQSQRLSENTHQTWVGTHRAYPVPRSTSLYARGIRGNRLHNRLTMGTEPMTNTWMPSTKQAHYSLTYGQCHIQAISQAISYTGNLIYGCAGGVTAEELMLVVVKLAAVKVVVEIGL